ncbi:hypothetical protein KY347_03255, partial [Candidatus Woesearchaeota archaeon]|nr:hypothetical protein [Candidatus Woesearchaeota archaeon]
ETLTSWATNLTDGTYGILVNASDNEDNTSSAYFNFTIDSIIPEVNTALNKSLSEIYQNDVINITANITDEVGLSFCQVIVNQSGPADMHIINISLDGAANAQCSNKSEINAVGGSVINFTIRANDTSNNWRMNDTLVTVADNILPNITGIKLNPTLNIAYFDDYNFTVNASDNVDTNHVNLSYKAVNADGINCWEFYVNGSCVEGTSIVTNMTEGSDKEYYKKTIRPDNIYPQVQFGGDAIYWENKRNATDIRRGNYHLFNFTNNFTINVTIAGLNISSRFWIALYSEAPNTARAWNLSYRSAELCNTSNWFIGNQAGYTISQQEGCPDSHIHLARNNSAVFFWIEFDAVIKETTKDNLKVYLLDNTTEITDFQSSWFSSGKGVQVAELTTPSVKSHNHTENSSHYLVELTNLNMGFDEADGVQADSCAVDTAGNVNCTSETFYFAGIGNQAPVPNAITNPLEGENVSGALNITWNAFLDPNNDLVTYNISLFYNTTSNLANHTVCYTNDTNCTSYTNTLEDGKYSIRVLGKDGSLASDTTMIGNFTIDNTAPVVNTTLNKSITSIYSGDVINITANLTDEVGLSFCQFVHNMSGFFNITNVSLSGTEAQCSNATEILLGPGNVINFTIRANDLSNNWRTNDTIFTVADNVVPVVNTTLNKSITSIYSGDVINITANITDEVGLSFCQFVHNMSGFFNITNVSLSGTEAQCSNATEILLGSGNVINFTIRVNDTSNNWRTNDTIITVNELDTTPPVVNATLNKSLTTLRINDVINVTANTTDLGDGLALGFIGHNMSGTLINYTFSLSGTGAEFSQNFTVNLTRGNVINFSVIVNDSASPANQALNDTIITVANTPLPQASIANASSLFYNANQTFNLTPVTDADSDAVTYSWFYNLTDGSYVHIQAGETLTSWATNLTDGTYGILVNASDNEDNTSSAYFNFTIDSIIPEVNTALNKSLSAIYQNDVINITANITDDVGLSFCQVIINQSGPDDIHIINISLDGAATAQCSNKSEINVVGGSVINFTIRANDTSNNWRMNDTIITVFDNTKPIINGTLNKSINSIYQYDVINATFNATDEVELSDGTVIINDTGFKRLFNFSLEGKAQAEFSQNFTVNCSAGCVINVTGRVNDTSGNLNQNETIFTVAEETAAPYCGNGVCDSGEDCSSCSSDCGSCPSDSGTGGGGGGGGAGGGRILLRKEFSVDKEIIKESVLQGETKTTELQIKNTGDVELQFSIEIEKLGKFIEVSENSFGLKPGKAKTIAIAFTASETQIPDVYSGKLAVKADGTSKNVITIIEVIERKALFDISLAIDENYKKVLREQEVKFNIDLANLGALKPVDVQVYYAIRDMDNKDIVFKTESLAVDDEISVKRSLKIPENVKEGDYIAYAQVSYNGQIAVSSDLFKIAETAPKIEPGIKIGAILALILVLVPLLILMTLIGRHYFSIAKEREKEEIQRRVKAMLEKGRKVRIITGPRPVMPKPKRDIVALVNFYKERKENEIIYPPDSEIIGKGWEADEVTAAKEKATELILRTKMKREGAKTTAPAKQVKQREVQLPSKKIPAFPLSKLEEGIKTTKLVPKEKKGEILPQKPDERKKEAVMAEKMLRDILRNLEELDSGKSDKKNFEIMDKGLLESVMKKSPHYLDEQIYRNVVMLSREGCEKGEIKKILVNKGYDLVDIDFAIETFRERKSLKHRRK